jgi:hypothetical protein
MASKKSSTDVRREKDNVDVSAAFSYDLRAADSGDP